MRVSVLAILTLLAVSATAHAQSQPSANSIDSLTWLSGCWIEHKGERTVEENWTTPSGGVMLSTGRTVKAGALVDYEFTRIEATDGKLVFTADPAGQDRASFTAVSQTDTEIVFENLDHDYPQHVRYRTTGPDSLHAEIDGPMGGQSKIISWDYRRCAP